MITLVTYADANMSKSQHICGESAMKHGVDRVWANNPYTVDRKFKEFNRDIWQEGNRGADCFWLFKPYVIYHSLLQLPDNDILIYADSGVEFVNNVNHIIDRMDENLFLFTNTHPNHHWTKRETLMAMGYPSELHKDHHWPQIQASVIFMKVSEKTRLFIKAWLMWCQMPGLITDAKVLPQYPYFQDHRHDQSILTNIAFPHGYKLHWWPTQYAEHIRVPGDTYPVLFNHHRKRNNEW